MRFAFTTVSLSLLLSSLVASEAASSDVQFLTALVGDYQDHKTDYIKFFATAKDVPGDLSTLATKVLTYTDDSYTTLLNDDSLNVSNLEAYATSLPWYSRIQADAGGKGSASGSASGSGSAKSTASAEKPSGSSASASSTAGGSSSKGGVSELVAPGGAGVGALAVALI